MNPNVFATLEELQSAAFKLEEIRFDFAASPDADFTPEVLRKFRTHLEDVREHTDALQAILDWQR